MQSSETVKIEDMIYGENKKFSLGHELSQKREIKSWGHKRKSSFLGKREKKNEPHESPESPSHFCKTLERVQKKANI